MSATCFEPEGSSSREQCCMYYRTHASTYNTAYTDAYKTHYTTPVYTTVFLKMNPRVRNM